MLKGMKGGKNLVNFDLVREFASIHSFRTLLMEE